MRQLFMLRRVNDVDAARDDRNGTCIEGGFVSGPVDAARKSGGDDVAGAAQVAGEAAGQFVPRRGGLTRADDGNRGFLQELVTSLHVQQGWRHVGSRQHSGISWLDRKDRAGANAGCRGEFALCFGGRA